MLAGCTSAAVQGVLDLALLSVEGVEGHVGPGLFVGLLTDLVQVVGVEHGGDDVPYFLARELQFAALVEIADAREDLHEGGWPLEAGDAGADRLELVGSQVLEQVEAGFRLALRLALLACRPAVAPVGGLGLLRVLGREVGLLQVGDLLAGQVDLQLEVLVHGVDQVAALRLDNEIFELLEAGVALVEGAELHDHLLLYLPEDARLAAPLERLYGPDKLLVRVGCLLLRLLVPGPGGAVFLKQRGVGDEMVGGFDQVVRRRLGDANDDDVLALAPEQTDERDKVTVARYQDVGTHLRVAVQKVRALHSEHHVYGVGAALLGLAAREVAGRYVARRDAVRVEGRRGLAEVSVGPVGVSRGSDDAPVLAGLLHYGRDVGPRFVLCDCGDVDVLPVDKYCQIFRHE